MKKKRSRLCGNFFFHSYVAIRFFQMQITVTYAVLQETFYHKNITQWLYRHRIIQKHAKSQCEYFFFEFLVKLFVPFTTASYFELCSKTHTLSHFI